MFYHMFIHIQLIKLPPCLAIYISLGICILHEISHRLSKACDFPTSTSTPDAAEHVPGLEKGSCGNGYLDVPGS